MIHKANKTEFARGVRMELGLMAKLFVGCLFLTVVCGPRFTLAQEAGGQQGGADETSENEAALAAYADAANFQTKGELRLAIEQWEKFLKEFPKDPMSPRASHYLGVCFMQLPEPDYESAAAAFNRALKSEKYGLREESLSNVGWCLYALASNVQKPQPQRLEGAIRAFETLIKEFPASKFADRALFYHAESLYLQGKTKEAVAKYDQLLDSRVGKDSPMRCDALYAKGIALEDLKEYPAAIKAYREMLSSCIDDPLAGAVKTQLAEVLVLQGEFVEAEKIFSQLIADGGEGVPRAIYRRAFVLTKLQRTDEAASLYDKLVNEFPDSEYAASAIMSAAQGYYLAGDFEQAKSRFEEVLKKGSNLAAATEAAHWLSVMAMRAGQIQQAESVAVEQIQKGVDGDYATTLRLDAAEAISMQSGRQAEALEQFEEMLAGGSSDPLLSRILYGGAITALQLGQTDKSLAFTAAFKDKVGNDDPLAADMQYVAAESYLISGKVEEAVAGYDALLQLAKKDNPQLSFWVMRASTANFAAGNYDTVIAILEERMAGLKASAEKAEAYFLIGSSHLSAERPSEAVDAFQAGLKVDPTWPRNDEMKFRLAASYAAAGNEEEAATQWKQLIAQFQGSRMADQARYRLAQQALVLQRLDDAIGWFDQLLREEADPVLRPFALYGKGRTRMQQEDFTLAIVPLGKLIESFPQHGFYDDALLARGISQRRLGNLPLAAADLQSFLDLNPVGVNLGNALLEMAIIERERKEPKTAITYLRRIVDELPEYPEIDKVRFELAGLLSDTGESAAAIQVLETLVERSPESPFAADANYKIGQQLYAEKKWDLAAEAYAKTAAVASEPDLLEKSLYRLGWSMFQQKKFEPAAKAFQRQSDECPDGTLSVDALMMVGESYFGQKDYEKAYQAFEAARQLILKRDGDGKNFTDPAEQQVRELVYLHGGQSAAQLNRWKEALEWYEQLRARYPSSSYLSQVFYETGLANRMSGDDEAALKFFTETANTFRDESSARARFMIGQMYFEQDKLAEAITEFKRVMYGYGAEKSPTAIRDWQAKSGFEAGRCAERLIQVNQGEKRQQAVEIARKYYEFVVEFHPQHPLAAKSRDRIEVLRRL